MLIVLMLAWSYARYGRTPEASWLMAGVAPVVIAIIADAIWQLGRRAITSLASASVGVLVAALSLTGTHELILLGASALAVLAVRRARYLFAAAVVFFHMLTAGAHAAALETAADLPSATLSRLTLFFLKIGSVLFGSGYVLIAFLRADLVERWHWLTDRQLLDAVTVGQVTPGPLFTTATFIGYLLGGNAGALLSTAAIFAPGFVFVALTTRLVPRLRASRTAGDLLDGVVAGSLGLMAATTLQLARSAIVDVTSASIAVLAAVALIRFRINSVWLVAAGAAIGWLIGAPARFG
jgi:chromate transporter